MLAITVAMAAVAVPMVFSQTGQVIDPTPDADFAFTYTEDVSDDEEDSLGAEADNFDPVANGTITVVMESGASISAEQLEITGTASEGPLVDGEFEDGDSVSVGTDVTVWANRGDTLRIIWTSADRDTTAVVGTFTVYPEE